MNRKLDECTVVSDDEGFEMNVSLGHCIITYREGDKVLKIEIERRSNHIIIYSASATEWSCPSGVKLGDADKERILNNVKGGLAVLDCPYRMNLY